MTTTPLYTGGGVSLSPQNGEGRRISNYICLMADNGKAVTNGNVISQSVYILASDVSNWTEIDEPEPPEPEPSIEDKAEGYDILMGVSE